MAQVIPAAAPATQRVVVQVPAGAVPGQVIQIQVGGAMVQAAIPPGVAPGQQFAIDVAVPAAKTVPVAPVQQGGLQMQTFDDQGGAPVGQIIQQPQVAMMPVAGAGGNAGPLEFLRHVPGLWIFQVFRVMEVFGWEAANQYDIFAKTGPGKTDIGPQLMKVLEKCGCFERQCWGPGRETTFNLYPYDPSKPKGPYDGAPLAMFHKDFHCQGCLCDCLRPKMQVMSGDGTPAGRVHDPFACCVADNRVYDATGAQRYHVTGTICQQGAVCPCCDDFSFEINDMQGNHVGSMGKAWRGCDELLTQTNKFWVDFPTNATPQEKALLIGSVFLIDFEYFEVKKN